MTPKPRKLPANCDIKDGSIRYRHRIPLADRPTTTLSHDKQGRMPPVRLCAADDQDWVLHKALAAVKESLLYQSDDQHMTLGWLHQQWKDHRPGQHASSTRAYQGLEKSTRTRYNTAAAILDHNLKINGIPGTLRQIRADQLDTVTLRKILDKRAENGATPSNLNNEKALIGIMYKWGKQYVTELSRLDSPSKGIEVFHVQKRTRYVTDEDYKTQYIIAGELGLPHIQDYMELTYLLAARSVEATDLKIGQATEQGIIVLRKKKSLNTGIKWSPRLRKVWARALARHLTDIPDPTRNIIVNKKGEELAQSTMHKHWGLIRTEMKKRGLEKIYFIAQNLKVKGVKDAENSSLAGQSGVMIKYYQDTDTEVEWFDSPDKTKQD